MSRFDDLFDETAAADSVFADKGALDPLATPPEEIVARNDQERELAAILAGVEEGYLPTTVSIYGPPGTGKTLITRELTGAYAERREDLRVEYVNLKECRTIFSAANEILFALAAEKKGAYEGVDGVFEAIWAALEEYPEWTVLILDEIDHIRHDSNYDPNDFFYRLLRGEGKLERGINLSAFLLSNEVLDVDLRLDSRVQSAMGGEEVFFPPYSVAELREIIGDRVQRAFVDGAVPKKTLDRGVQAAAERWGDARKALRLFRQAGECANERGKDEVTVACIEESLKGTERETTVEKLRQLPLRHLLVVTASVGWRDGSGDIVQPVRVSRVSDRLSRAKVDDRYQLGQRATQQLVDELETMGLIDTWVESGGDGRAKYMEVTFDPECVHDAQEAVLEEFESSSSGD